MKYTTFILSYFCSILISLSFANHPSTFYGDSHQKIRASIKAGDFQKTLKQLTLLDIDIAGVDVSRNLIDVLIGDEEFKRLSSFGFILNIIEVKGVSAFPDEKYKNPQEIESILRSYTKKYPKISKIVKIGESVEKRAIWAIKISDNSDLKEPQEPSILFNSMHHAREIMTPEVSLDIIDYLLSNYKNDQRVQSWVDSTEIWIVPMLNVDGNAKMWNEDKWWRKNNRGGYGVDLNRNYPEGWKKCRGSSGRQSSSTYRGDAPASEPETRALMGLVKMIRPVFNISYHSYSELVIYPKGCRPQRAVNQDLIESIGKTIASKLDYTPGTAWELLYNADGGDIDWMYEAYQVIPYVIELNSRREGFHPDFDQWRDKTVKRNRVGWKYLLDRLKGPGIRGRVKNNDNTFIFVKRGIDNELLQTYKVQANGYYHLILAPGVYQLEFSKDKNIIKKEKVSIKQSLMEMNIAL